MSDYSLKTMTIIRLFQDGKRDEALDLMLDMAEAYPGRGWEEAHAELIEHEHIQISKDIVPF